MPQEERKKACVAIIIIAFILGLVIGYVANDIIITKERYTFEGGENILKNSGFEGVTEERPAYWYQAIIPAENLTMTYENEEVYNGNRSVNIKNNHIYDEEVSNNWAQTIRIVPLDRIVELSGWVKTIDAESVVMVIQCWDEDNKLIGFGSTQSDITINGTTDWTEYSASVKVPIDTESVIVRLVLTGTGQVWFDDVTLVVK